MQLAKSMLAPALAALTVLGLAVPGADARADTYGDWSVTTQTHWRIAKTSNELSTVGVACDPGEHNCFAYIVSNHTPCTEGTTSALLLSSPAGSAGASITCMRIKDELVGVFDSADALKVAIATPQGFSVVTPLVNGSFEISSFSSRGAATALKAAASPVKEVPASSL